MKRFSQGLTTLLCLLCLSSCLRQNKGQYIPGVEGPKVNVQNGKILLTLKLLNIETDAGLTLALPDMQSSLLTVSPSIDELGIPSGTLLKIEFDLKDVESDKFRFVPEETLPDGRSFPFLASGTLPAFAIHVPQFKDTTFYASKNLFGFFLPITLPEEFNFSVHYRIKINGKNYGIVSLIHPNEAGQGAGIVVLLTLEEIRNNSEFQKLLKYSLKKKKILF